MPLVIGGPYKGGFFGGTNVSLSASGTLTDGPVPPPVSGFPLLGIAAIGGWSDSSLDGVPGGMPGRMQRIGEHAISIIGPWRTWTYTGSTGPTKDLSDIATYIKTFNSAHLVYVYTNTNEALASRQANVEPYIEFADTKAPAEQWWLYDGTGFVYPDDVKFPGGQEFVNAQINLGSNSFDSGGVSCAQWWARGMHAKSTDSGDWVTTGFGIRHEYDIDGVYQDIMRFTPRTAGDFDEDSIEEAKDSTTGYAYKAQGDTRYHNEWDVIWDGPSTPLHGGNYTQNPGVPGGEIAEYAQALASGYQNLVHGVFLEALMGRSSSIETFADWQAMMRYYKRAMTLNAGMDPQHTFFDNWLNGDGTPLWTATHTQYEWGRYGLCSCLLDNGYYGLPTTGGFTDCVNLDEYQFSLGSALAAPDYDGQDPATATSGSGYNSYEQGVYLREFEFGCAIVNPKGNGNKTITLPNPGTGKRWDRLDSRDYDNQEFSVNDGATGITSQLIEQRKGIILKRTTI